MIAQSAKRQVSKRPTHRGVYVGITNCRSPSEYHHCSELGGNVCIRSVRSLSQPANGGFRDVQSGHGSRSHASPTIRKSARRHRRRCRRFHSRAKESNPPQSPSQPSNLGGVAPHTDPVSWSSMGSLIHRLIEGSGTIARIIVRLTFAMTQSSPWRSAGQRRSPGDTL